jgi:ubiquinone/menaquinone biosynthesis C-methylase UbiE
MPDPYASIASADAKLQARLAAVLELRAAEAQQRAMLEAYLAEVELPASALVLDVGCGTGAVARALAQRPNVREVVGIDPSPVFIEKAREYASGVPGLSFHIGDARAIQYPDASFDLVVFHTVLCHVPEPERALREAHRVLCPGGWLAVFDGDYTTASVAIGAFDPLQSTVDSMIASFVHNPWLTRGLKKTLERMGFAISSLRSHGYLQTDEPAYMMTIVDRGADLLLQQGSIGAAEAESLKSEARRRVTSGEFFGHISFLSVIARAVHGGSNSNAVR